VETDCTALEEDPNCGFISSDCVKYAQGESGLCHVFEIDNVLMELDAGNALRGSWETLRSPVVSAWSEVTRSFTSTANSLMGKTAAEATDAAAQLSLDAFKQALMKQTAE
jgi:hypothetical protein